jgi:hypothetical protein
MPSKHAATDPTGQREYKGIPDDLRLEEAEKAATVDALPLD